MNASFDSLNWSTLLTEVNPRWFQLFCAFRLFSNWPKWRSTTWLFCSSSSSHSNQVFDKHFHLIVIILQPTAEVIIMQTSYSNWWVDPFKWFQLKRWQKKKSDRPSWLVCHFLVDPQEVSMVRSISDRMPFNRHLSPPVLFGTGGSSTVTASSCFRYWRRATTSRRKRENKSQPQWSQFNVLKR